MASLRLEVDYGGLDREFSRMEEAPGSGQELSLALAECFADAQAHVHVISGALKASGKSEAGVAANHDWEGQFTFGGPSPVPPPNSENGEVVYAWYEMRRGGIHDYFSDHGAWDDRIGRAVRGVVEG